MDQTRVELLQELREWYSNPRCPILWLSGMAGTGKSTIARTVADELYTNHRLAGSFFFRRAGKLNKAHHFVTTLAHQLAVTPCPGISPSFKELVGEAILTHGEVLVQGLRSQWKELVMGPLSNIQPSRRLALTFVIDALDECGSNDEIRLILQLFIELTDIDNIDLSVLMTSRPETTLIRGFQDMPEILHRRLDLRSIPRDLVEHDLYIYMKQKLGRTKSTGNPDWLNEEVLASLVRKSNCLFIFAATVCLFIENSHDAPEDCISNILQNKPTGDGDTAAIDDIYTQVLSSALTKPDQRKEMTQRSGNQLRFVVGSIVTLLEMLSITALSDLLSMKIDSVQRTLGSLESVLNIPSDTKQPIRLLHPSFRDFLLDKARCRNERFQIQSEIAHAGLAIRCLDVIREDLRRDICDLKLPDSSPQEVSRDLLNNHLPKHVQYACQHWIGHLECASPHQRTHLGLRDGGEVHDFFQKRFLYWMEAMSLMGKMPETVLMKSISALLKVGSSANSPPPNFMVEANMVLSDQLDQHPNLHAIVKDAERFLLSNKDIVQRAPLQTYASALVFSPYKSQIRKENLDHCPTFFKYGPVVEDHWGPVLQTLQGHSSGVASLAFSSDGKYLASLSIHGELLVWDAMTGTLHSTLWEEDLHNSSNLALNSQSRLVFSCNGQLASLASATKVQVWDLATGVICRHMRHHENCKVVAITFASHDTLAVSYSGSPPTTWMYKAGAPSIVLETRLVACALSFLSEGTLALLCSNRVYEGDFDESELVLHSPRTQAKRRIAIPGFAAATFSSNDQLALSQWPGWGQYGPNLTTYTYLRSEKRNLPDV